MLRARGPAPRAEPVGHEGEVAARPVRPRPRPRPVLRHRRHVDRVDAHRRRAARHRPHQRRGHRAARTRDRADVGPERPRRSSASPSGCCRAIVDSTGVIGAGHRAARRAADRRARRRPAGVARRPGLRAPRRRQDHVRHRRHARRRARHRRRPRSRRAASAAPSRSSPGAHDGAATWGLEAIMLAAGTNVEWLRDDLGIIATSGASRTTLAASVRRHRRRRVRARAARPRHAGVGLRRARHAARPHPRHRTGRSIVRAVLEGIAHRGADLVDAAEADAGITIPHAARRRRHDRRTRRSCRRSPTRRSARSRSPRCSRPPRSAPRSWPASPSAPRLGRRPRRDVVSRGDASSPAAPLDRARWQDAVDRAGRWIPALSASTSEQPRLLGVSGRTRSTGGCAGRRAGGREDADDRRALRRTSAFGEAAPADGRATSRARHRRRRVRPCATHSASCVSSFSHVIAPTPSTTSRMPTMREQRARVRRARAEHDFAHETRDDEAQEAEDDPAARDDESDGAGSVSTGSSWHVDLGRLRTSTILSPTCSRSTDHDVGAQAGARSRARAQSPSFWVSPARYAHGSAQRGTPTSTTSPTRNVRPTRWSRGRLR